MHAWLTETGNNAYDFVPSLGHLRLLAACALRHAVADTAFNVRHPDGTQLYFCGVPAEAIARDTRVAVSAPTPQHARPAARPSRSY